MLIWTASKAPFTGRGPPETVERTVALIGYMGSGKSTVGRVLARKLDQDFVDLDREISLDEERSIQQIFEEDGEAEFRKIEHETLARVLKAPAGKVVSCGGGVVTHPPNRRLLENVPTVFLQEEMKILYVRTRGGERPLRAASREEFERRYLDRLPHYREFADLEVSCRGRGPEEVTGEIMAWLKQ